MRNIPSGTQFTNEKSDGVTTSRSKSRVLPGAIAAAVLTGAMLPLGVIAMIVERAVFGTFYVEGMIDRLGLTDVFVAVFNWLGING